MVAEVFRYVRTGNIFTDKYTFREGSSAREFNINQLHQLLTRNAEGVDVQEDVKKALVMYKAYLAERKKIYYSNKPNAVKHREGSKLEEQFAVYKIE